LPFSSGPECIEYSGEWIPFSVKNLRDSTAIAVHRRYFGGAAPREKRGRDYDRSMAILAVRPTCFPVHTALCFGCAESQSNGSFVPFLASIIDDRIRFPFRSAELSRAQSLSEMWRWLVAVLRHNSPLFACSQLLQCKVAPFWTTLHGISRCSCQFWHWHSQVVV